MTVISLATLSGVSDSTNASTPEVEEEAGRIGCEEIGAPVLHGVQGHEVVDSR